MKRSSKGETRPSKFVSAIFASKPPEGLTLKEYSWENEYQGTESAFIESGFIKPEWLPGKPGNAKRNVRVGIFDGEMKVISSRSATTAGQWVNGFIRITRTSQGQLTVSVNCLPAELEKREEAEFAKRKLVYIKEAYAEIDKDLSCLPANSQEFIEKTQHTVRCFTSVILNNIVQGSKYDGGYRFSSDVIADFEAWAARAIQLIQEAHIHFDPDIRQNEIAGIKGEILTKHGLSSDDEESIEERRQVA